MLIDIKDHSALVCRIINDNIKEYRKILERKYLVKERKKYWFTSIKTKEFLNFKKSSFKNCLNIQIPRLSTHNDEHNAWQLHRRSYLFLTSNHLNVPAAQHACW